MTVLEGRRMRSAGPGRLVPSANRFKQAGTRVWRCSSIARPMTCSVKVPARRMRHPSVIPVVLRPSSVRIKNKTLTHGPCGGEATAGACGHRGSPRCDRACRCVFDSHGGRAEDHGEHGGRGSHGRRLVRRGGVNNCIPGGPSRLNRAAPAHGQGCGIPGSAMPMSRQGRWHNARIGRLCRLLSCS